MRTIEWYFDFISPYSFLQIERFDELPEDVRVEYRPILFAAILNHWGQKGPAEISSKRKFIYRHLTWQAKRHGIAFHFPRAHPFNPLAMLRLCIALDNNPTVIRQLFRYVWRDGRLPDDTEAWSQLLASLDVHGGEALLQSPQVKQQLRANGERAIALNVFGVPTFIADGELFWGVDAFEFFLDYLKNPALLKDPELSRVSELPVAASRI